MQVLRLRTTCSAQDDNLSRASAHAGGEDEERDTEQGGGGREAVLRMAEIVVGPERAKRCTDGQDGERERGAHSGCSRLRACNSPAD
jgi:hypothetical protein